MEQHPDTRYSDTKLYVKLLEYYESFYGYQIGTLPFAETLLTLSDIGIPSIETVGRCRRKIQHDFPELCSNDTVNGFRAEREKEFKEWSRS